jgi:sodium/hydrogen antiporter
MSVALTNLPHPHRSAKLTGIYRDTVPALLIGIGLGLLAKRFIDETRWNPSAQIGPQNYITLGIMRVMIGVQLVFAGYQLPAKYQLGRWREMLICLVPVMTTMWLCTTACIMVCVPNLSLLAALVIGSCVSCTDPVISQAIAKGPFADQYVPRPLREIISSEAGANDGFCFPFLMLAVYLMRHSELPEAEGVVSARHEHAQDNVGRQGGGIGVAMKNWCLETWLYIVILSVVYGALVGYGGGKLMRFALKRKWVDSESYHLFPSILGVSWVYLRDQRCPADRCHRCFWLVLAEPLEQMTNWPASLLATD